MVEVEYGVTNTGGRESPQDSFRDRDPGDRYRALGTDQGQRTKPGRMAGRQQKRWKHSA